MAPKLPTDAQARKQIPIYSGFIKYFPRAMAAVAELSRIGNEQHNPGQPLHWDRSKSTDELDAAQRHIIDAGTIDNDGVRHSTKLAWRAMANLEKELEGVERLPTILPPTSPVPEPKAAPARQLSFPFTPGYSGFTPVAIPGLDNPLSTEFWHFEPVVR